MIAHERAAAVAAASRARSLYDAASSRWLAEQLHEAAAHGYGLVSDCSFMRVILCLIVCASVCVSECVRACVYEGWIVAESQF